MSEDIGRYVGMVTREVGTRVHDGQEVRVVVASRRYQTTADDLWEALTNPERIPRWFLPVEGDLRLGGRFQFKGNAGGEILECEPPRRLRVTWAMGEPVSWVTLTLTPDGDGTRLELEHAAPVTPAGEGFWVQFGPGAVGVGWDGALYGLGLHIDTGATQPPDAAAAFAASEDGKRFMRLSSDAWREAAIAGGMDPEAARAAAERTTAFYTGAGH